MLNTTLQKDQSHMQQVSLLTLNNANQPHQDIFNGHPIWLVGQNSTLTTASSLKPKQLRLEWSS